MPMWKAKYGSMHLSPQHGGGKEVDPWNSLASQPLWIRELHVQGDLVMGDKDRE